MNSLLKNSHVGDYLNLELALLFCSNYLTVKEIVIVEMIHLFKKIINAYKNTVLLQKGQQKILSATIWTKVSYMASKNVLFTTFRRSFKYVSNI